MILDEYITDYDIDGKLEKDFDRFRKNTNFDAFLVIVKKKDNEA